MEEMRTRREIGYLKKNRISDEQRELRGNFSKVKNEIIRVYNDLVELYRSKQSEGPTNE